MSLWFRLNVNSERIGMVEIQRRSREDDLDPCNPDTINVYFVRRDGRAMGTLTHRYGLGAWSLLAKAADLIAGVDEP